MAVDYEVEYNNRARVPEHPQIFARWEQAATDYRAAAKGAEIGVKYGPSPRQTIDLFPTPGGAKNAPLALFIHGGWWRSLEPSMHSFTAKGPNAHGVTVALAGYDLCPTVTLPTVIEELRAACLWLWRRYRQHIMVYGHSAGGHLAACMVATDWKTLDPDAPADLVPAAYGISGVYDLAPVLQISVNDDLRLNEKTALACSPLYWGVPQGRSFDAVVGGLESSEFLRQTETIAEAWRQGPTQVRHGTIAGANHFTVIDPLADPASAMTQRVVELARGVHAID